MGRKTLDSAAKEERKLKRLKECYEQVCADENIDTNLPVNDQVKRLLEIADEIETDICNAKDELNDYYWEKFNEIFSKKCPINRSLFMQLVNLNTRRGYATDKALANIRARIDNELFYVNAKHQFLKNDFEENFEDWADKVVKIPKEDGVEFSDNFETNSELDNLLKEASKLRFKITKVYKKQQKDIASAVEYITRGDVTNKEWNMLVNFKHYKNGYPNDETLGKMEAFTNKIEEVFNLYNNCGLSLFNDFLKERNLKIVKI